MIEQLMVKDYVLFDHALIDFQSGMSVITGTTGAGKSLLIDAIEYLCGKRITGHVVRQGKEKAILQMVISNIDHDIQELLLEKGIECEEDQLIVSRQINVHGKSTMRFNESIVSLSLAKEIVPQLIDIHSQMDTYRLMSSSTQMEMLDRYAHTQDLLVSCQTAYKEYVAIKDAYDMACQQTFSDDALEYASEQFNLIQESNIFKDELATLQQQLQRANEKQDRLNLYREIKNDLTKTGGLLELIYSTGKLCQNLDSFEDFSKELMDDYYRYESYVDRIEKAYDDLMNESLDIDSLQERIFLIKRLYRKFGGSYESMMEAKDRFEKQIDAIIHRDALLERLKKDLDTKEKAYLAVASSLSSARQACFDQLAKDLSVHFKDLKLTNARFCVDRKEKAYSENGIDSITFMVSMNPGQAFSPLKDSASGGELSRLMLALKVVFQSDLNVQTIIFDEIDTGVSGDVSVAMAKKMKSLSKSYQVFCITHLASVACFGDHHFVVSKSSNNDDTLTHVKECTYDESIEELAMMASGSITQASLIAAKELKDGANG